MHTYTISVYCIGLRKLTYDDDNITDTIVYCVS